jgi:hypothetical protein
VVGARIASMGIATELGGMMKKLLAVGVGLLGFGCALESGAPEALENVESIEQGVVTRTKNVSFLPARICDAFKTDIDAWGWSCFGDYRHTEACKEVLKAGVWPAGPRWKYVGSSSSLFFTPEGSTWQAVDDEISVANVEQIACYNVDKATELPLVLFRDGLGPGKKALEISTIFEHIRSVTVSATATIVLAGRRDPAYNDTVEIALQTQNAAGAWVDRAVRGSDYVYLHSHQVEGDVMQVLTTSAKVPANEPTRVLLRMGPGAVSGSDVSFSLQKAELRGEECVPSNNGGCL